MQNHKAFAVTKPRKPTGFRTRLIIALSINKQPRVLHMINYSDPNSVLRFAVISGVMTSDGFINDRDGFVDAVTWQWSKHGGMNSISVVHDKHYQIAGSLYSLYMMMRQFKQEFPLENKRMGKVLKLLMSLKLQDAIGMFLEEKHFTLEYEERKRAQG